MSNFLRPMRTFFTMLGAALPTPNPDKHGQFQVKQAAATEDELYNVLRDSSGVLQNRRILTKTYADTLYGAPLTVKEGGSAVDATVNALDFDASDFNLTESPEDTVTVALAYGTSAGTPAEGNHTHDADYADIAHDHDTDYVELTGDTMSGALIVDVDSVTGVEIRCADDAAFVITKGGTGAGEARVAVDTVNNSTKGYFNLANEMGFVVYDDDFSTKNFEVDGTDGRITRLNGQGILIASGSGSPEGVVTAIVGSLYLRTDGSTSTTLYVKTSGSGNTGWTAK